MFHHILSPSHTEAFLKDLGVWSEIVTLDDQIEEHKENGKEDYIEIVHSDEMYPWPYGTAPWCSERNGTGILPSSLQEGGKWKMDEQVEEDKVVTFSVKNLPPIKKSKDAQAYLDAAMEILNRAHHFHKKHVGDKESGDMRLDLTHSLLKANIALMKKISDSEQDDNEDNEDEIQCLN